MLCYFHALNLHNLAPITMVQPVNVADGIEFHNIGELVQNLNAIEKHTQSNPQFAQALHNITLFL